jgi:hypothetical protein
MTRDDFVEKVIQPLERTCGKSLSKERMEFYYQKLGRIDEAKLASAVDRIVDTWTESHFPMIAEIKGQTPGIGDPDLRDHTEVHVFPGRPERIAWIEEHRDKEETEKGRSDVDPCDCDHGFIHMKRDAQGYKSVMRCYKCTPRLWDEHKRRERQEQEIADSRQEPGRRGDSAWEQIGGVAGRTVRLK